MNPQLDCVFIVILNWNRKADTLECLRSLSKLDYQSYQIVLVDNGSQDGTVESVRKSCPDVHIIANQTNCGFAAGSNQGIKYALSQGAGWVLLLNNDTTVAPDFLSKLIEASLTNPTAGMLAPKIYYYHQPTTIWSAGSRAQWFPPGHVTLIGLGQPDGLAYNQQRLVDYAIGCAVLVRKDVFRRVGLLDERFFMFFEDYDYSRMVTDNGYNILFVPDAKIWHKDAASTRHCPGVRWVYLGQSTVIFYRKHFRWVWLALGLGVIWVSLREAIKGNHKILKDYWQGIYMGLKTTAPEVG